MENTINIGIDLGTTNSLIAKYNNGEVEVFRNPVSWKETLPSVVAFRKNRTIVGEKAREFLDKEPQNVVGSFKRKMGTNETFFIETLNRDVTPVELSALVLKELKTFALQNELSDAAVITIPASFDTIQSNATKQAGYEAGFKQVVLLQEPIAASLAYSNKSESGLLTNGYWLVYDLGGGTFDVALVKTEHDEMRVIDHEGDNFLGGKDFDSLIVEKILIPYLKYAHNFEKDAENQFKSATGKYNKDWYILLKKAEEAKIELSRNTTAEIELRITGPNGELIDDAIDITREKFEELIREHINETIQKVKQILERNNLPSSKIKFVLMIGGSTYIPYVRQALEKELEIKVNTDIDPTNAVAIGAALFAGTKLRQITETQNNESLNTQQPEIQVKLAYEKMTKDTEVYFAAKIDGDYTGMTYKIYRTDGGFDSGTKSLSTNISETLPLVSETYNFFNLKIFDSQGNELYLNLEQIGIAQGQFSIAGQPLPEDICLELDNPEMAETKLHLLFRKNSVLPITKTETRLMNKTIRLDSEEQFVINVLEGPADTMPIANKTIGFMAIKGTDIKRDLLKGADIDLSFQITESRDLVIKAYIPMLDQEFVQIFTPTQRNIPISRLLKEIEYLRNEVTEELNQAAKTDDFETAKILRRLIQELEKMITEVKNMPADDVTDKRYQIEDKKRKAAVQFYSATKNKHVNKASHEYFEEKIACKTSVDREGTEQDKKTYEELTKLEGETINSGDTKRIKELARKMAELKVSIWWRNTEYITWLFEMLKIKRSEFTDKKAADNLIESGNKALDEKNYNLLKQITMGLLALLPNPVQQQIINRSTGLI